MQLTAQFTRRYMLGAVAAGSATFLITTLPALAQVAQLTRAQKEEFLLKAEIVKTQSAPKGVTDTVRATLDDGKLTHEASIQTIDVYHPRFESPQGVEFNFKDTWKFNVAAYKLDQLLGLNMVPVTVERRYRGKSGSFTWWVDDVVMDELERSQRSVKPPDTGDWNNQMHLVRVFDQLIYNADRNITNLLIDKTWRIWMIDHGRAFRTLQMVRKPEDLEQCDQDLLEKLRQLNEATVRKELGRYLTAPEIRGLVGRRDRIVKIFEEKGPTALYKSQRRPD